MAPAADLTLEGRTPKSDKFLFSVGPFHFLKSLLSFMGPEAFGPSLEQVPYPPMRSYPVSHDMHNDLNVRILRVGRTGTEQGEL